MADDARSQERTERATPQRRRDARRKGQVAKSHEINSVLMLTAGLLVIAGFLPWAIDSARALLAAFIGAAGDGVAAEGRFGGMLRFALTGFFRILAPVFAATAAVALGANLAQVGFHVVPAAVEPRLDKLDPVAGFKRIFGKRAPLELGKGLLKVIIVGLVAWATFESRVADVAALAFAAPGQMAPESLRIGAVFVARALIALGALAAVDYAFQRWEYEKAIRMTVQDIKDELKENEGDPLLRGRMRAIQHRLASQRMLDAVKDAALVITNPTHYAVALGYDEASDPAPRVLAKGVDAIAARIRERAREYGVPIVEKPALARLLHRECEIGRHIPAALYEAVAEVLAFVLALKRRGRR
jgi:flagellar biosynthetic protein FlhB